MPELPEVETSRRGIAPYLVGKTIQQIVLRHTHLRWLIPSEIPDVFAGQIINAIDRRGKYLLFKTNVGTLIMHLGMSGSLRIMTNDTPAKKHDHVDIQCSNGTYLRLSDPRRFGCLLWTDGDPLQHKLLRYLGPEPLSDNFNATYLYQQTRKRKLTIKQFIMNSRIVVGVGNIYANEALHTAGIRPTKKAGTLTKMQCTCLCSAIKKIIAKAIKKGGTTLKDFTQSDGKPGYFSQSLNVYGRAGKACNTCGGTIKDKIISARNSFYCPTCQS